MKRGLTDAEPRLGRGHADRGEPGLGARLGDLVREIPGATLVGEPTVLALGVHHDSRSVEPGDVFVARRGAKSDGHRFIADAIARGAVAVILERGADVETTGVARIEVADAPTALAFASAAVYGHPTFALDVIGLTGTNGKTTTAHLVQAAIDGCGGHAAVVGTLGYELGDYHEPSHHTSPEADELARVARRMIHRGATHLVMEVSSIALAAKRAEAVRFRVAAFTNLTQDHLDYHGSMEDYAAAKARLFFELAPGSATVNVDDAFGRTLANRLRPSDGPALLPLLTYGLTSDADVRPVSLEMSVAGITMTARTPSAEVLIRSPLVGAHNVSNLLCALATAELLELDLERTAKALSAPIVVAGRLERCDDPEEDDVVVLVDYAHTPDALERVLDSVRSFGRGKIICVFGCGGDRDPTKRPLMGKAVARRADVAIVTNDNPRSEDPRAIADAILPGLEGGHAQYSVELDRHLAIERAILEASPGDVVLIAGKGHEPYQIIGATTSHFDDREEARAALAVRRGEST